jgi:A/G-specific adenine glycosylase
MDFGALLCTRSRPRCFQCPLQRDCLAYLHQQTDQLPTPRPKKVLPQRRLQVLVIQHGAQVLLQRRPPLGIWGGLLSLPEVANNQTVDELALHDSGASPQLLATLEHGFTHFRLTIEAWRIILSRPPVRLWAAESDAALSWWPLDDLDQAGLPTPIRKILQLID